jgi:hypothetical protein
MQRTKRTIKPNKKYLDEDEYNRKIEALKKAEREANERIETAKKQEEELKKQLELKKKQEEEARKNDKVDVIYTDNDTIQKKLNQLYIPNNDLTKEINESIRQLQTIYKKEYDADVPNSFKNGVILMDQKEEDKTEPKEVLLSKMKKNEYGGVSNITETNYYNKLRGYTNYLPNFKQYKDVDNVNYIIKNHLQFIHDIIQHNLKNSPATLKTDLSSLLRVIRLSYSKAHPLYVKYAFVQKSLNEIINKKSGQNELNKHEQSTFLQFDYILNERQRLEDEFKSKTDKTTSKAYGINQDLLLLSLYTLTPPLRREVGVLQFTDTKPDNRRGDYIYFNRRNQNISLELYETKKKHGYVSIPLNYREEKEPSKLSKTLLKNQTKLADLLKESYELYPRKYVFTNKNSFPKLDNPVKDVSRRLTYLFSKYGVNVGASSIRSSFVSNQFSKFQHTRAEKELIATLMRTSVEQLDLNYNKILNNEWKQKAPKVNFKDNKVIVKKEENDEEPERQVQRTELKEDPYEKQLKRSKEWYEKNRDKKMADGKTPLEKKKENWEKKDKHEYRKQRYIRDYNKNYSQAQKLSVQETTLNKYGLSKYDENGNLKDKL